MNRGKKITREDGTRWAYGYNDKGEVTSGLREKAASPNTAVPGWNHAYTFDEIGNRLTTTTNSRVSTYTPNNLNQIASRTIPRAFDVIGNANSATSISINGAAATRLDEYFYKELTTGSGAVHVPYTVQATDGSGTTTRNGGKFLAATPETFTYDDDGNMTSDGRFNLTWDGENRLIRMQTLPTVPLAARRKLGFAYDAMGRRISKTVWHGTSGGGWQLHHKFDFIHELGGWNILAEKSGGSNNSLLRTYTWGTDLSGNLTDAGGVGGLLFTKFHTSNTTVASGMDLNGDVTLLVNTATGQSAATYDYGPFGEPLRQSDAYAMLNPFRFSTKYTDDETGLLDYGHRHYDPSVGRWLNRDPIFENGGYNLYGFVRNSAISFTDFLGMKEGDDLETYEEQVARKRREAVQEKKDGAKDLKGLQRKLEAICDKVEPESDANSPCKTEAATLANKIQDIWNNNHGLGLNWTKSSAGGYLCYEWAGIFDSSPKRLKLKMWSSSLGGGEEKGTDSYIHYWAEFSACGRVEDEFTVDIDDGFMVRGKLVHDGGALPGGGNWREYTDKEEGRKNPGGPDYGRNASNRPMTW